MFGVSVCIIVIHFWSYLFNPAKVIQEDIRRSQLPAKKQIFILLNSHASCFPLLNMEVVLIFSSNFCKKTMYFSKCQTIPLTAKSLVVLSSFLREFGLQSQLDFDICTQTSSSQKLLALCSKNCHPRSSLHVCEEIDERNQSMQPATKEGSLSCLELCHVSQLQRGSAAATSL